MNFDKNINTILNEDLIPGGLADNLSIEDIAKKHNVSIEDIKKQYEIGIKVEMEHTNDHRKAKEITKDHLYECPTYYTKLDKLEKQCKNDIKEEMVSSGVVGTSGYTGGIAAQDNIPYAQGDARIPKSLFTTKKRSRKRKMQLMRRNLYGM